MRAVRLFGIINLLEAGKTIRAAKEMGKGHPVLIRITGLLRMDLLDLFPTTFSPIPATRKSATDRCWPRRLCHSPPPEPGLNCFAGWATFPPGIGRSA